jgi:hypothetical protein
MGGDTLCCRPLLAGSPSLAAGTFPHATHIETGPKRVLSYEERAVVDTRPAAEFYAAPRIGVAHAGSEFLQHTTGAARRRARLGRRLDDRGMEWAGSQLAPTLVPSPFSGFAHVMMERRRAAVCWSCLPSPCTLSVAAYPIIALSVCLLFHCTLSPARHPPGCRPLRRCVVWVGAGCGRRPGSSDGPQPSSRTTYSSISRRRHGARPWPAAAAGAASPRPLQQLDVAPARPGAARCGGAACERPRHQRR